ncbi:hypothetical protein IMG5_022850 [Ichthyophthirius multifiliis]|uniref:Uncharacterized protein n=1 Tax=Ichthyophthirius multifiliis TaxID=5932 RepID=G0QKV8_ICHMU|nr:hypothetical protein IMG5_022850 [Ichthyophthirius multifiliis]EGR34142.1 hypothetical protein IMG5_022850 [Ichthyophthirius multifiliis]|eukprot:XP_004039446.1 hypothetical protein IMG5_022850 [Ichthyophthirius multifiliis]
MKKHLEIGGYQVDVPTVIALVESPYESLQNLGIKILTILSDPNKSKIGNYEQQFENYIKQINELTLQRNKKQEFVNNTLKTVSNLALKDSIRPHIIHHKGIEILLAHLRNDQNVEGQRISAKGLLNLSIGSRDIKMRIVGELAEEIQLMHKNEIDSIVYGYIQTLLVSKDNKKDFPDI